MYLVDTNVLSEARRGSNEARTWLRSVDPSTIYHLLPMAVITTARAQAPNRCPNRGVLTVWLDSCDTTTATGSC
jgi:predicted nucleic acid-binding protein